MRLNGLAPSAYPIERVSQRENAPVPYGESERVAERARESIVTSSTQAESAPEDGAQGTKSESIDYGSVISGDFMPARFEAMMERPLSSRATLALQSYGTTATFSADLDAHEVLGLDLYA